MKYLPLIALVGLLCGCERESSDTKDATIKVGRIGFTATVQELQWDGCSYIALSYHSIIHKANCTNHPAPDLERFVNKLAL
jgi:hypothetical protein